MRHERRAEEERQRAEEERRANAIQLQTLAADADDEQQPFNGWHDAWQWHEPITSKDRWHCQYEPTPNWPQLHGKYEFGNDWIIVDGIW